MLYIEEEIPNAETMKALNDISLRLGLTKVNDIEEFLKFLES
jgi:hypothetical protein